MESNRTRKYFVADRVPRMAVFDSSSGFKNLTSGESELISDNGNAYAKLIALKDSQLSTAANKYGYSGINDNLHIVLWRFDSAHRKK